MDKVIIKRIENQIRQQLFGTLVLMMVGLMLFNSFGLVKANDDNTNLTFNVTAGDWSLVNAPNSIAFPSRTYGSGAAENTGNEEIDGPTVTDYRGSSTIWGVTVNANNLAAGTNSIHANKITVYPNVPADNSHFTNVQNFDIDQVTFGSSGTLNDAGSTLFNASTAGSGIVQYDNGFLNLTTAGTEAQGAYTAIMFYTLA